MTGERLRARPHAVEAFVRYRGICRVSVDRYLHDRLPRDINAPYNLEADNLTTYTIGPRRLNDLHSARPTSDLTEFQYMLCMLSASSDCTYFRRVLFSMITR